MFVDISIYSKLKSFTQASLVYYYRCFEIWRWLNINALYYYYKLIIFRLVTTL